LQQERRAEESKVEQAGEWRQDRGEMAEHRRQLINSGHLDVMGKLTTGLWSTLKASVQKMPSEKTCLESIECLAPLESVKVD